MAQLDALIAAAKRSHPAFRFATATAGIAAFVVIFARFGVNWATIVFGSIVMLSLMIFFVVFVRISALSKTDLALPALVALWSILILILATVLLLFTSAFFDKPLPIRSRLLATHTNERIHRGSDFIHSDRVRVALVIGNSEYSALYTRLSAPENDIKLVADALRKTGFRVKELPNGTRQDILNAWKEIETVGRYGGVALLYYSGHGKRENGADYILPVSYDGGAAINLSSLMASVTPIDRSLTGVSGDLALYSTSPGSSAVDVGPDRIHSPFALAFAESITSNQGDIREALEEVARRTQEMTNGQQVPWISGTFFGRFSFHDRTRDEGLGILRLIVFDAARFD